jgi:hypothetical protein
MTVHSPAGAAHHTGLTRRAGGVPEPACVYSALVSRTEAYLGPDDAPLYLAEILTPRLYEGGQRQTPLRGPGRTPEAALRFLHARIVQHTGGPARRDTVSYAYDRDDSPAVPVHPRAQRVRQRADIVLRRARHT